MISVSHNINSRFRGGLAWMKYLKKDMGVTFSYYRYNRQTVYRDSEMCEWWQFIEAQLWSCGSSEDLQS